MKRVIFVSVALALLGSVTFSQPTQAELRRQTFEIVWRRVQEKHFDPNLNGVDWEAVRRRYEPRVAAGTEHEFHRLLNEMLGELRQSHFVVFPPEIYTGEESKPARAEVGIEVQMIAGRPTITRVEPSSPAEEAGLRPGFIVTQVGAELLDELLLPLIEGIRAAMKSLHDAPGIILDLRGNAGGEIPVTTAVASLFHTKQTTLGTTRLRQGELHRLVFPNDAAYPGSLVILTDEGTGSAAETFTAALQENGRARIVGRPTVGGALPSVIEKLPTGARLQYAIGEYRTPKGIVLEGRGVLPDVPVELTRRALLAGRDPILEKAIAVVLQSQRQPKTSRSSAQ